MGKLGIKFNKNVFDAGRQKLAEGGEYNDVTLEPGRYICVLTKGRAQEVSGKPKIVFDLKVAGEAEQAGGRISIWFELSEDRSVHLFRTLDKIGYDVSDLDEEKLSDILADIEANPKVVRITAKQGGEYVNYYIDKLVEDLSPTEALAGAGGDGGGESAADADAAGGKAGVKAGAHAKAGEPEPEPEPEPEAPVDDGLDAVGREDLKKILKAESIDFKVFKNTTDDAIREAIRTHRAAQAEPEPEPEAPAAEPEPPAEPEAVELKVGMKVTVTIRGKDIPNAVVKTIDEKAGKVKVQLPDKSLATVGSDQISV